MTEPTRSFMVEMGWLVDTSGQNAAEAALKATEDRITAENARALAQRVAQENRARQARISAEIASGRELSAADKQFVADAEKRRQAAADAAKKSEAEAAKRSNAVRADQFKQAEAGLLRMSSVAQTVASGVAGALSAAPFGGFMLGVTRTAGAMSDLAVQSQRVGASAAGIERFLYAMKQAGVSEGAANSTLEGFSKVLKSNPKGYRDLLEGWGVRTRDAKGNDLSQEEVIANLGRERFAKESLQQATTEANRLGITDDNAINALRDPNAMRRGYAAYDAKLGSFGLDPNQAAADARKVQQAYDSLEADLSIIKQKINSQFFLPMMAGFEAIAKKMEENPEATKALEEGFIALSALATLRVIPTIARVAASLTGLNMLVGTLTPMALRVLGLGSVGAGAAATTILAAGAAAGAMNAQRAGEYGEDAGTAGGDAPAKDGDPNAPKARPTVTFATMWDWLKGKAGFGDDQKVKTDISATAEGVQKLVQHADEAKASALGGGGGEGGGVMGAARRALGWAGRSVGYSPASGGGTTPARGALAANQKEAYAAALKEGLSPTAAHALVANMSGEGLAVPRDYHWDGTHMASGIVQWDPTRSARIKAQFGAMPHQLSVADQTRAAIWEMKTRPEYAATWRALQGNNAADMIGALVDNYERPGNRARAKAQRMGYFRGFHPETGGGTPATTPTVSVNGTPSHADAPIGDQAALDAHNRIVAGKGRPGDREIIDAHRRQQNAPTAPTAPVYTKEQYEAAKRVAETAQHVDVSKQKASVQRAIELANPIIAAYEKLHPRVPSTLLYGRHEEQKKGTTNTLSDLERSGHLDAAHRKLAAAMAGTAPLDIAHQRLADAMKAEAAQRLKLAKELAEGLAKGTAVPKLHPRHLVSPQVWNSINHGTRTQHNERHGDHFHIHTNDSKSGLDHAVKVSARRGAEDRIRNGQG